MREDHIETVAIVGLGALGVLFAKQFQANMPRGSVRIVADSARIDRYLREGVYCNDVLCDFYYVDAKAEVSPADLVIFCVKYHHLEQAMIDAQHQIGEKTLIISALNGIRSERDLEARFGAQNIIYSVSQEMDALKVGNRLTYTNAGQLAIGSMPQQNNRDNIEQLVRFFSRVNFPYQVVEDMQQRLWGKLMVNVGVNQVVGLYEGSFSTVQQPGEARELYIAAMREVMAVASREGVEISESDLHYWIEIIDKLDPKGKPSLRQDLEAGRETEVALFSGTIIELGKQHQISTPVNQRLYEGIRALESQA